MKNILLLVLLLISSFHFSFGQFSTEQYLLSKVNPHWKDISLTASEAIQVRQCKNKRDLIQLHLALVTEHLTVATHAQLLSADIKQRRLTSLSELTAYFQKGVFPLNTKHETPTPIFVDEAGTRCAVGELMYKSGQEEIVTKISRESNLSHISQLNRQYAEIGDWADANGFTVDELAWIQPSYPCNTNLDVGEIINVSCHGGSDGAFFADPFLLVVPWPDYSFSLGEVFYFDSTNWIHLDNPDCLSAGLYKQHIYAYKIYSSEVDTLDYFVTIQEPDPITATYQIQGDANQCQAYIDINASGGTPPYEYFLYNEDLDTLSNLNLCAGIYWIEIKDNHQCSTDTSLNLLSSAVKDPEDSMTINVFPNPTNDYVQLRFNEHYPIDYAIYNSLGIKVVSGNLVSPVDQINLTNLVNGAYYFVFEDVYKRQRIFRKIIKTTF